MKNYEQIFTIENQQKLHEFRDHLAIMTNSLIEICKAAGRCPVPEANTLLRECYNLVDAELHTIEEWEKMGYQPRESQHGYMFWYNTITRDFDEQTSLVHFLYARDQMEPMA